MPAFRKYLSFAGALVVALGAAAPAAAFSVALKPLNPHAVQTPMVGIAGACANPNSDARVASAFFEVPTIAALQGVGGTAGVAIELSPTGSLVSESVIQSTGNPNLDRAALRSARMSRFTPEVSNCSAIGGNYLYTVTF
ncbi:MAG TPA: TonB family protein [Candidatus Rubrimentiphilum sp.]|nr:TonB family protein [Candidatus Rubrimentiphilum sp.]